MNRHVNAIAGRMSLRKPQRESLERLDRILEITLLSKNADLKGALETIQSEFPSVTDFEREFPSLCFALATGVGKTRLMGAFVTYLHLAHGIRNFFVLAPNLTIYNKLITDFTPNTLKYVFKGIAEFSTEPPLIITGDNYDQPQSSSDLFGGIRVNIFNISKINSEVRGGKSPVIKRLSEFLGQSYFAYLSKLEDLVLLMDESHRYRASAGVRALNELKPVLGLELTATPFVESNKGPENFKNILYDYALAKAMEDGFVKEPAVVTRENFNPTSMSQEEIERIKLEDGIRLHEGVKVELETYARESGNVIVKPFLLVIARDTTHAGQLVRHIQSDAFFEGRYKDKVIQVDSSKIGAEEDQMIQRLLAVESTTEPTEIVIHVNMLKEGWDVTNLYTIVPLRAANARTLIEQSIGRGLRLPYGKRTGVQTVDTLNIVAHDRFQEIVDEAKNPGSKIRLRSIVLNADQLDRKTATVVSRSVVDMELGILDDIPQTRATTVGAAPVFRTPGERRIASITKDVIRELEKRPEMVPDISYLGKVEVQSWIVSEVTARSAPEQIEMEGLTEKPDIAAIVAKTTQVVEKRSISIPRVFETPIGEVRSGFKPFSLKVETMRYQAPNEDLWQQHLRTGERKVISLSAAGGEEERPENYVVKCLVDFDDVSYDQHSDLLYGLASQALHHFETYLPPEDAQKVMRLHQREIARFIHSQMHEHFWEDSGAEFKPVVSSGFEELHSSAFTVEQNKPVLDFRIAPVDLSKMPSYVFGGFQRCLADVQKFHSNPERILALVLDRDALKWIRTAKGQPRILYRWQGQYPEYQPDFIAEMKEAKIILESKSRKEMDYPEVLAKKEAALRWCRLANDHARSYGGKPWMYALIPHDEIKENMTLEGLVERWRG